MAEVGRARVTVLAVDGARLSRTHSGPAAVGERACIAIVAWRAVAAGAHDARARRRVARGCLTLSGGVARGDDGTDADAALAVAGRAAGVAVVARGAVVARLARTVADMKANGAEERGGAALAVLLEVRGERRHRAVRCVDDVEHREAPGERVAAAAVARDREARTDGRLEGKPRGALVRAGRERRTERCGEVERPRAPLTGRHAHAHAVVEIAAGVERGVVGREPLRDALADVVARHAVEKEQVGRPGGPAERRDAQERGRREPERHRRGCYSRGVDSVKNSSAGVRLRG